MSDTFTEIKNVFKTRNACVLIPTYNNAQTLPALLTDVARYTDNIIVVNDGSTDGTSDLLKKQTVEVVSYSENKGKGWALRQGFRKAVELGYNYAITIDSDGQHFADDLAVFLNAIDQHPNAIIIGARNMEQSSVPGKSSFGNKFSNFWFWVETGLKLPDTQSGYRLYPVKSLSALTFFTRKYEFEIEVIVRAAWKGIEVTCVPVKVFYPEKEKRISHFRPFRDFSRISVLNTVLVAITFLYIKPRDFFRGFKKNFWQNLKETLFSEHESALIKSVSVGFGIFMGIVPIWGFQLVTAIALAILLRLNKTLVIIAANISIPPMLPFILYASMLTGSLWVGKNAIYPASLDDLSLAFVKLSLFQYVSGAITLALMAGFLQDYLRMFFSGYLKENEPRKSSKFAR